MTERRLFPPFKTKSYVGLFQYHSLPACARHLTVSDLLPHGNPYVGYFYHDIKPKTESKSIESEPCTQATQTKCTLVDQAAQTDDDESILIGDKIRESYKIS